jgi:hypothetical protein
MTAQTLTHRRWQRPPTRRGPLNGPFRLGWLHFWLLIGILGGMLALVGFVFVAYLAAVS